MKLERISAFPWAFVFSAAMLAATGCQQESGPASGAGEAPAATASAPPSAAAPPAAAPQAPKPAATAPASSGKASAPAAPKAAAAPRTATLDAGTALKVRTTQVLSTETQQTGATFTAVLEEPLTQGTWVIAPKGATVHGKIASADKGGRVKGVASLAVSLTGIETAGGQTVDISTDSYAVEAASTVKKDAVKVAIGTGIGAAIGAIAGGKKGAGVGAATGAGAGTGVVLATRGDNAEIPGESVLTFTLSAPVTFTEKK